MNVHFRRAEMIQPIKIAASEGMRWAEPPSVMSRLWNNKVYPADCAGRPGYQPSPPPCRSGGCSRWCTRCSVGQSEQWVRHTWHGWQFLKMKWDKVGMFNSLFTSIHHRGCHLQRRTSQDLHTNPGLCGRDLKSNCQYENIWQETIVLTMSFRDILTPTFRCRSRTWCVW